MNDVSRGRSITLMLTFLIAITGCGPTKTAVQGYTPSVDVSGLELDMSQSPMILYNRPGAPDLGHYNRFIIDPVMISYDDPKMKELTPEQTDRMQRYLRDAIISELRDAGYAVGTKSKANTMRISFTISGFRAPSAIGNVTSALAPFAVSVGAVTVEGVFRDALTNRIDGVAVSRSQGSRVLNPTPWSTWADVEATFDQWAKGFREEVDKAHGR